MVLRGWVRLTGIAGVAAGLLAADGGVWAVPLAAAAAPSRDKVRLELLDGCVYDQWKKRQEKDNIVDECQCAAKNAATQFSDDQVSAFKGKLSSSVMPLWQEAVASCFKS